MSRKQQTAPTDASSGQPPKLFISYSWSTKDHEKWVLELATELRESGVDVILDKWDLREGHDALHFMESMVGDPKIEKVALICDGKYVVKANSRTGGAGTEAQIISAKVYAEHKQEKFVAVVLESDSNGAPLTPTYYSSKIFIDFRDASERASSYEQLLRWALGKPLYIKPPIGRPPSYLDDEPPVTLETSPLYRRSIDAIKSGKPYSAAATGEFFDRYARNFDRFRIQSENNEELFDQRVFDSIAMMRESRTQLFDLLEHLCRYSEGLSTGERVHRFLEGLLPYMDRTENVNAFHEWDFDNFRFEVNYIFLYALASFLRYERFAEAAYLLDTPYYIINGAVYGGQSTVSFSAFRQPLRSFEYRNMRLKLNRISLRADLLKELSANSGLDFVQIKQADFTCFLKAELEEKRHVRGWMPETLAYSTDRPFEVFARSASKSYFDRLKVVFGLELKEDFQPLLTEFRNNTGMLPSWNGFDRVWPEALMSYDKMCTLR